MAGISGFRLGRWLALAAVASVLAASPARGASTDGAGGALDSPPVLLRDSLLLTPVETAGTGLAPEVDVRLTVDDRGRVLDVEVLSITPSSAYDDLFRRTVVEALESWRYAPARSDGEPVEATLRWTIQFREKAARSALRWRDRDPGADDGDRRMAVFTLSAAEQEKRLRHLAGIADGQLDPEHRRRAESPRFVVTSDSPDEETAQVIAGNLEAVFGLLDETFGPVMALQPVDYKLMGYAFWDRSSFRGISGSLGRPEWSNGLYAPPGLFAFHLETGTTDALLGMLIHEAVHAYVDRHLVRPGLRLPPWLNEGLAEYFGMSEIRKGRLTPGSIREGKYAIHQRLGGAYRRKTEAGWSLNRAQRAVRTGEATSPGELLSMEAEAFYGEEFSMHYALSWLLVHYLRHGEPGWAADEFPALLLYLAEGYPAGGALEAVYGTSPADLAEPFREYVASL